MGATKHADMPRRTLIRRLSIAVKAPDAKEVVLTGDFTDWAKDRVRLSRGAAGEWRTTLPLPVGEHQYRLIVDGEWRNHDGAVKRVPNPFGTENDVLIVS